MTKKQTYSSEEAKDHLIYQNEIKKAFSRIGGGIFGAANWLIRFAERPIHSMSRGELLDLGYEINCLSDYRLSFREGPFQLFGFAASYKDWYGERRFSEEFVRKELGEVLIGGMYRPYMITPDTLHIQELQQLVAGIISSILNEERFDLLLPPLRIYAYPNKYADRVLPITLADSPKFLFTYNVALIFIAWGHRIRKCPECEQIFFAERKNKMNCSARCQNTAAVRRLRETKQKRRGKREPPGASKKSSVKKITKERK